MRWFGVAALFFFLLFPGTRAGTQERYSIKQAIFLPPVYYVGDRVEIRVRISVAEGVIPAEPSALPESDKIKIHSVRVIPMANDYDIRIEFSSYDPGIHGIPQIDMGSIVLDSIRIETSSFLDSENAEFQEIFDPLLLPGTRLLFALGIGVVLLGPFLSFGFFGFAKRFLGELIKKRKGKQPIKKLMATLHSLSEIKPPVNNRDFYFSLTVAFRRYVSARVDSSMAACTTNELAHTLDVRFAQLVQVHALVQSQRDFDRVRFGGAKSSPKKRGRDLALVSEAAAELESLLVQQEEATKRRGKKYVDR